MQRRSFKAGDWLVRCDLTDGIYYRSECRMMWNGMLVHHSQYEERHPMDTMKVYGERNNVKDARPDVVELELNHTDRIP